MKHFCYSFRYLLFVSFLAVAASTIQGCHKPPPTLPSKDQPKTRVYYIAAEEQIWDYAPKGMNVFMGMYFDATDSVYAVNSPSGPTPRIGSKNIKARYVEYTDSTFSTPKAITAEWQHLGILGPVIRAVVGDSVVVHFRNRTSINTSIHVHGLLYDPNSEGATYAGSATTNTSVAPGDNFTYHYFVRDESGPGNTQGSSICWLYHSHVNMDESDMYAGLVGGIVVTRRGMADENARPTDVDREFMTLVMVFDENASALLDSSIQTFIPGFTNPNEEDFEESNKKHSINGMFMGNLPGLVMNRGERVRWYVMALGNEVDLHTPHWHGNTVSINGINTDVLELLPAAMLTADMVPDNPGTWGFHCHVSDHMTAGMTALYTVH